MKSNKGSSILKIILTVFLVSIIILFYLNFDKIKQKFFYSEAANLDTVIYIKDDNLYKYNFLTFEETKLNKSATIKYTGQGSFRDQIITNATKNRVVLAKIASNESTNTNDKQIILYNLNTLEEKILIDKISIRNENYLSLQISPDAKKIAYSLYESDNKNINIIDENNKVLDQIQSKEGKFLRVLCWSPDSSKLLYRAVDTEITFPDRADNDVRTVRTDKKSKVFIYDINTKKSTEVIPEEEFSQNAILFDYVENRFMPDEYLWRENNTIQVKNHTRVESVEKFTVYEYDLSRNKATKKIDMGSDNSNPILYMSQIAGIDYEQSYFKDYKYILILTDYLSIQKEYQGYDDHFLSPSKLAIYNTQTKDYKTIIDLKNLKNFKNSIVSNLQKFNEYSASNYNQFPWYIVHKYIVQTIYWTSDHKSLIFEIVKIGDEADENNLAGVYKVNVDGTNLEKINKEVPDKMLFQ